MISKITPIEFGKIQKLLIELCGIALDDNKEYLVESRLAPFVMELGLSSFSELYEKLQNGTDKSIRDRVIDLMTTNETLWFRDDHPFRILKNKLLPEFAEKLRSGEQKKMRIWSNACSTGQEPYSIAMIILEAMENNAILSSGIFEIFATDISTSVLRIAKMARYDTIAISRGLPGNFKERYFVQEGRSWVLSPRVKEMVTFEVLNLQNSFDHLGPFDIVLCRNVAIYFSDQFKRDLFSRIAHILKPDGILFLGASESLSNYSSDFSMEMYENSIFYRVDKS